MQRSSQKPWAADEVNPTGLSNGAPCHIVKTAQERSKDLQVSACLQNTPNPGPIGPLWDSDDPWRHGHRTCRTALSIRHWQQIEIDSFWRFLSIG